MGVLYKIVMYQARIKGSNSITHRLSLLMIIYSVFSIGTSRLIGTDFMKQSSNLTIKKGSVFYIILVAYLTIWMCTVSSLWTIAAVMLHLALCGCAFSVLPSVYMSYEIKERTEAFNVAKQYQNILTIVLLIAEIYMEDIEFYA